MLPPPTVGLGTLRRLAAIDFGGRPVLSMYVDLGAPNGPAAAARELEALVTELAFGLQGGCVEAIRESLRTIPPLAWGTRGLAVFAGSDGSPLETVPLPARVSTLAVLDAVPWVEPLAGMLTESGAADSMPPGWPQHGSTAPAGTATKTLKGDPP